MRDDDDNEGELSSDDPFDVQTVLKRKRDSLRFVDFHHDQKLDAISLFQFFVSDSMITLSSKMTSTFAKLRFILFTLLLAAWMYFSFHFSQSENGKIGQIKRVSLFEIPIKNYKFMDIIVPIHILMYFKKTNMDYDV